MDDTSRAIAYLANTWHIPLRTDSALSDDGADMSHGTALAALLQGLDARVVMATALWLSILEEWPAIPAEWTTRDRRRLAYVGEIARCLRLLRSGLIQRGSLVRPAAWVGLEPGEWQEVLPLFASVAPVLPASRFGRRWGIAEVVGMDEYSRFQRFWLEGSHCGRVAA